MVEVASSNLAGPTKQKRARLTRAFLCLEVYHTLGMAHSVDKRDPRSVLVRRSKAQVPVGFNRQR